MAVKPTATAVPSLEELKGSESPQGKDIVLSFDISGTCIGWALGCDRKLITYGKYVFKSTSTQGEKVLAFSELLDTLLSVYKPSRLVLEQPLHRAMVRKHFEFLGILRLRWMQLYGEDIQDTHLLDPRKIKQHLHISPGRDHAENKKRMVDKINSLYGLSLKFHPGSAYQSDDDVADAIGVMTVFWILYKQ